MAVSNSKITMGHTGMQARVLEVLPQGPCENGKTSNCKKDKLMVIL